MTDDDYKILVTKARRQLARFCQSSVDAKDAHDFAMDSLMACGGVNTVNLNNRIIDGFRRALGRKGTKSEGRFKMHPLSEAVVEEPRKNHEPASEFLSGVVLDERQRFVAIKLSEGLMQCEIAALLGISRPRMSEMCKQIRKAMLESGNWNRRYYEANQ